MGPLAIRHAEGAASLVLAGLVLAIAALLAWREHRDRGRREPAPAPDDARHFHHQDLRRTMGIVIMAVLAFGLVFGSRVDPRGVDGRTNPVFLATWLIFFALLFGLLALAMVDWIALRVYAGRARRSIARERVEILRDELQRRKSPGGNGRAHGPIDDLG